MGTYAAGARCILASLLVTVFVGVVQTPADATAVHSTSQVCPSVDSWSEISGPIDPRAIDRQDQNSVLSIAVDHTDVDRIYAGAVWGLYLTSNCGSSWEQIFGHPVSERAATYARAVSIDSSGRTFVAGYTEATLFVRSSANDTWRAVTVDGSRLYGVATGGLVSSGARLYVKTASSGTVLNANGLGYSDDGGANWIMKKDFIVPSPFVVDSTDPTVVYAVGSMMTTSHPPQPTPGIPVERLVQLPPYSLIRSVDSGASFLSWSEVQELPGAVAVSVDRSRFWFASYAQHLWQSRDAGASWQIVAEMPFTDPQQLAVSPHDPRILYAVSGDGHIWVYREPDAGPTDAGVVVRLGSCSTRTPWLQLPSSPSTC